MTSWRLRVSDLNAMRCSDLELTWHLFGKIQFWSRAQLVGTLQDKKNPLGSSKFLI